MPSNTNDDYSDCVLYIPEHKLYYIYFPILHIKHIIICMVAIGCYCSNDADDWCTDNLPQATGN